MKRALLLLCAFTSCGFAPPDPAPRRYVPVTGWQRPDQADFYENWFGAQLRAMDEPYLSEPADLDRFTRRFRLLVLPTFQPGFAVRIDETPSGGRMRFVKLNGRGGYSPGTVARQRHATLSSADMRDVNRAVRESGMDRVAPYEELQFQADGEIRICPDATTFVFEWVDRTGSHFVTRDQCTISPALSALMTDILEYRYDLMGSFSRH